jgi:hypothetical protein
VAAKGFPQTGRQQKLFREQGGPNALTFCPLNMLMACTAKMGWEYSTKPNARIFPSCGHFFRAIFSVRKDFRAKFLGEMLFQYFSPEKNSIFSKFLGSKIPNNSPRNFAEK